MCLAGEVLSPCQLNTRDLMRSALPSISDMILRFMRSSWVSWLLVIFKVLSAHSLPAFTVNVINSR